MDLAVETRARQCHDAAIVLTEGKRIALRRDSLRWNQRQLATAAGVGLATITRIEKDRNVQRDTLRAVLDALDAAEAERPTLTTPSITTEPSVKEGADDAVAANLRALTATLLRVDIFLSETLDEVRRAMAALDSVGQAQKSPRKRA